MYWCSVDDRVPVLSNYSKIRPAGRSYHYISVFIVLFIEVDSLHAESTLIINLVIIK